MTTKHAAINSLVKDLAQRIVENDEKLTNVSLRRLPLFAISFAEIFLILESLASNTHIRQVDLWLPDFTDDDGAKFEKISNALQKCLSLTHLTIISSSSLLGWKALLHGAAKCPSIRQLTLGEASLEKVSTMSISMCEGIMHILEESKQLSSLTMRGFSIPEEGAVVLARGICKSTLTLLELHQVESDPSSFGVLMNATRNVVKELRLIECDLSLEGPMEDHPMFRLLENNKRLDSLQILECGLCAFDSSPIKALAAGMLQSSSLKVLALRTNQLTDECCHHLSAAIESPRCQLNKLVLEDNNIGNKGLRLLCNSMHRSKLKKLNMRSNLLTDAAPIRKCKMLEILDLSENSLHETKQDTWIDLLLKNPFLDTLKLESTKLSVDSILGICQGLEANDNLRLLNLAQNHLGLKCPAAISSMLSKNQALEYLELSSCSLGDEAIGYLVEGLVRNKTLRELNLGFNNFGDDACRIIGSSLPRLSLTTLDVPFNKFGDVGLKHLVTGVENNNLLTGLFVLSAAKFFEEEKTLHHRLFFLLSLNRAGRRALTEVPDVRVWPSILSRASNCALRSSIIYFFLQHNPDIVQIK